MNMAIALVLAIAIAEIGYYEKISNSGLDSKTENAGSGNFTKYARDLDELGVTWGNKNGFAWCAEWCLWVFYKAFGITKALQVLCSPNPTGIPVCSYGVDYFKKAGRWFTSDPHPGDIIFFMKNGVVTHQGIVEKVEGDEVATIEGNTSDMVARRVYSLRNGFILGYGRPNWDLVSDEIVQQQGQLSTQEYSPVVCMMTQSTCYRGTGKMKPVGVLWHSTGANNPWIKRYVQPDDNASDRSELLDLIGTNAYRNDWNHKEVQAGLNAWIGKLADGTIATVQTMPWDYKPWGCGGGCNNGWIQFEICEDSLADKSYFDAVYDEACKFTAYICKLYNIDPFGKVNGVPTILCHQDSYRYGMGSNHSDVYHWFNRYGKTMDDVRSDVAKLLGEPVSLSTGQANGGDHPTVRKGAYSSAVKEIQEKLLYIGYDPGDIDSDFGDMTYAAVKKFQRDNSLEVDGVVGPQTWAALDKAYEEKKAESGGSDHVIVIDSDQPNVKKGDLVSIKDGATYYNGKAVPAWVQKNRWIVASVSGDRAVINKCEDGRYAIYSPINTKFLTVVNVSGSQQAQDSKLAVGDTVRFTGSLHYISAFATSGRTCKPGTAKITKIALGSAKHPYHVVALAGGGSTVHGWVDTGAVEKV